MKMKVSITREFDLDGEHKELFEELTMNDKADYALFLFANDIDNLVKYNEVSDNALLEVIK